MSVRLRRCQIILVHVFVCFQLCYYSQRSEQTSRIISWRANVNISWKIAWIKWRSQYGSLPIVEVLLCTSSIFSMVAEVFSPNRSMVTSFFSIEKFDYYLQKKKIPMLPQAFMCEQYLFSYFFVVRYLPIILHVRQEES